jgi:hypothetical protein
MTPMLRPSTTATRGWAKEKKREERRETRQTTRERDMETHEPSLPPRLMTALWDLSVPKSPASEEEASEVDAVSPSSVSTPVSSTSTLGSVIALMTPMETMPIHFRVTPMQGMPVAMAHMPTSFPLILPGRTMNPPAIPTSTAVLPRSLVPLPVYAAEGVASNRHSDVEAAKLLMGFSLSGQKRKWGAR